MALMIAEEHRGYKNVKIYLFRTSWDEAEEAEVHWSELVQDYDQRSKSGQADSRVAVMELFIPEEIEQLKIWFRTRRQTEVKAYNVKLPLSKKRPSFRGGQPGHLSDFIIFSEERDYDLPCEVWGYYNLKTSEGGEE